MLYMNKMYVFFQVSGMILLFIGLIILAVLQFRLSRKENRSFITFLSIVLYPNNKLTKKEIVYKRLGSMTLLIGFIIILLSGFEKFVDSFRHFNDPPAILMDKSNGSERG